MPQKIPPKQAKPWKDKSDHAYDLPATEGDEFGKRKVEPSTDRKKSHSTGKVGGVSFKPDPNKVEGASEGAVFKKAQARIQELKSSKKLDQDF